MIIIQIALGIVLAAVIICFWQQILAVGFIGIIIIIAIAVVVGGSLVVYETFSLIGLIALVISLVVCGIIYKSVEKSEKSETYWRLFRKGVAWAIPIILISLFSAGAFLAGNTRVAINVPLGCMYVVGCFYLSRSEHLCSIFSKFLPNDIFIILCLPLIALIFNA